MFIHSTRDQSKNDTEAGQMKNENTGNNAADGAEAQNTAVAAPISESSPSGQPLKNGVQRHQGGLRDFRDESPDKYVWFL